jgi:hypothetical protein
MRPASRACVNGFALRAFFPYPFARLAWYSADRPSSATAFSSHSIARSTLSWPR